MSYEIWKLNTKQVAIDEPGEISSATARQSKIIVKQYWLWDQQQMKKILAKIQRRI